LTKDEGQKQGERQDVSPQALSITAFTSASGMRQLPGTGSAKETSGM
jgi:hypothetical protein